MDGYVFPKTDLDFPNPKTSAPEFGIVGSPELGRNVVITSLSAADSGIINRTINRTTSRTTTTMAPNLALHKRVLIQSTIDSKLQGDDGLKDDEIADIAGCSTCAVRRIPSRWVWRRRDTI